MTHYKSNQRDLEFNLFEVFGAGERMGKGPYVEMDEDVARDSHRPPAVVVAAIHLEPSPWLEASNPQRVCEHVAFGGRAFKTKSV